MTRKTRKRVILAGIGLVVLILIVYGFLPERVRVETAAVHFGPLKVTVEEEGETQVANTYTISSPATAFARRIDLEPGDYVERGQPVVPLEPPRSAILDPRSQAQARARVQVAQSALEQAERRVRAAGAAAEEAEEERQRVENLFEGGSATRQTLTRARSAADQAQANLDAAQAAVAGAEAELENARAALQQSPGTANLAVANVLRAPVAGRVLAVHHKSEGQVNPGEPLVVLGDVENLEVRVDVLSQDAVRITSGTRAVLDQWGGDTVLDAVVSRVEPQGFTDVSSLGVEEKRVAVVANLTSPPDQWTGLGAGYRVLARFIVWEAENVLLVPTSALFRADEGWAVFAVVNGSAERRPVEIGHQTGLLAEVLSGLEAGDEVIVHPENTLADGTRVAPRED